MPVAALSRSARRVTMAEFLPPISAMTGRKRRFAVCAAAIRTPTACEPVNVMPPVSACWMSISPASAPVPFK